MTRAADDIAADSSTIMFRILGPIEILKDDQGLPLRAARLQTVLAMLLLEHNQVVAIDQMADALWDDSPPSTARSQVQICVSGLRRMLIDAGGGELISTRGPGYLMKVSADQVDARRFERLVARANALSREGQTADAAVTLRQALALWSGPALGGVASRLVQIKAVRLDERRLNVFEDWVDLELRLGRHRQLVSELGQRVAEHPLRERLRGQLMLALYRSGRQVEALDVYRNTRAELVDQFGIEPGEDLRRLEGAILANEPELQLPEPVASIAVAPARPAQLTADAGDFTGREALVAEMTRALTAPHDERRPRAVPVVVVVGKGGVGKSTLAVHVAHLLSTEHFPDGQLHLKLRGSRGVPLTAAEVLARCLRSLGVAGAAIPEGVEERAELYRSLLAGKRVLILLEDAADETQLELLLPGSPTCAVIVTSRSRLTGLPGGQLVEVDVFDRTEAVELLGRIAGRQRVDAEPAAADALVRLVGALPLALRITGARLAARPHWTLATMVQRLSDECRRLDELVHGELKVRASISLTYNGQPPLVRRLFRGLCELELDAFPHWVAAAVLDIDLVQAQDLLEQLVDAQLLDVLAVGPDGGVRYRFHDLIKIFAREKLQDDPIEARQRACARVCGGWLALAEHAHAQLYGGQFTLLHGTAPRWRPKRDFADLPLRHPLEWLESERANLVSAVRYAANADLSELSWDLAMTLVTLFEARCYHDDWEQTHQAALAAAQRTGNRRGTAAMMASLGSLHLSRRRTAAAAAHLQPALEIFEDLGDRHGTPLTLRGLAYLDYQTGAQDRALCRYQQALAGLREVSDRIGEAYVLGNIAQILLDAGDSDAAASRLHEALRICRSAGNHRTEAQLLHRLGSTYLEQGRLGEAENAFVSVLRLVQADGDRSGESHARLGLSAVRVRRGDLAAAEASLGEALQICRDIADHVVGARVRLELGRVMMLRSDRISARRHLTAALGTFREYDVRLWEARAEHCLAALERT